MQAIEPLTLAAIFILAGLVKGVTGLGLPTVGVGLLGLTMPPAEAAALVMVPALVTNVWQMLAGPALRRLCRRLWPLLAGIGIGTWLGGRLLGAAASPYATPTLGAILVAHALLGLCSPRQRRLADRLAAEVGALTGAVTGSITAATGIFVIPAVPYLQALGLERRELIQALGMSFTMSTVALAVLLTGTGTLTVELAGWSVLALVPALLGQMLGGRLADTLRPEIFRRIFFAGLLLLGGHLALWPRT